MFNAVTTESLVGASGAQCHPKKNSSNSFISVFFEKSPPRCYNFKFSRMFSEGDIKKLKRAIEGVEDKSFCPSCQMILSFDVENLVKY